MTGLWQRQGPNPKSEADQDPGPDAVGGTMFSFKHDDWRPAGEQAAAITALVAFPSEQSVSQVAMRRGPGLPPGEAALACAAAARLLGCFHSTASHARSAAEGLRQTRQVRVLLEEGVPSPLTGRLGAVIAAAAALTRSPPLLAPRDIWRLEETTLDENELLDLVHASALTAWTARLRLALGQKPPTQIARTESDR